MREWHTTEFCETCAKEFCCTSECKYHLLHRIKETREEIAKKIDTPICGEYIKQGYNWGLRESLDILDKLIAESEEK